jgi:hypothetical protein
MKFLCAACDRLVELDVFRVEAGRLRVVCSQCGEENQSEAEARASEQKVANGGTAGAAGSGLKVVSLRRPRMTVPLEMQAPDGFCPKCISPRSAISKSCKSCGLVYANFRPEEHLPSAEMTQAWERVTARWDDVAAHDAFLAAALGRGELAQAARLYRIRLASSPADPAALRARDEVIRLATLPVALAPNPREAVAPTNRRRRAWVLLFAVLLSLWGAWLVLSHLAHNRS